MNKVNIGKMTLMKLLAVAAGCLWLVTAHAAAPDILAQPEDQCVFEGGMLEFTVGIDPIQGYRFAWYKVGDTRVKHGSWHYVQGNITAADAGLYECRIYEGNTIVSTTRQAALFVTSRTAMDKTTPVLTTVTGPLTILTGSRADCPGTYTSYIKLKGTNGSQWFTPPTGATHFVTLTDSSVSAGSYTSRPYILTDTDLTSKCGTNTVAKSQLSGAKYQLTVYYTNAFLLGTTVTNVIRWE